MSGAWYELEYRGPLLLSAILFLAACPRPSLPLSIQVTPNQIVADGTSEVLVRLSPPNARMDIVEGRHAVEIVRTEPGGVIHLRTGILPSLVRLRATAPGGRTAFATLTTALEESDRLGDGTPDFLRLGPLDRQSFRLWFTYLAEAQFFRDTKTLPSEIDDCAALIRYCYRQAFSKHTSEWVNHLALPLIPAIPAVGKYAYPYTPLLAALFRTRAGPFRASDLRDGTFAEFANARTLQQWNCHFVSRDLSRALPGDILFFKQLAEESRMPFHSMIYLGASQVENTPQRYVLYHTGPSGRNPGEIRRLTVKDLIGYPSPQWRPLPGNENFLGVYRWNVL